MYYLIAGVTLGLSAGFAPGPLLAMVISETLQHGVKAGLQIALAPVLTDLPLVLITVLLLSRLAAFDTVLAAIAMLGGVTVAYMGCKNIFIRETFLLNAGSGSHSLAKGFVVNLLSPHPYLFWFSVGAPMVVQAGQKSRLMPAVFIISFYCSLIGAKMLLAVLTGRSRFLLTGRVYFYVIRVLGIILCGLAVALFYNGIKLMGIA